MMMSPEEAAGMDVWDKVNRRIKPPPVQASPGQAAVDPTNDPYAQPAPPWARDVRGRGMQQTQGGQYETGDPDIDAFLRARAMDQIPQDDAHAEAYRDPNHFERLMRGMYRAGQSGDREALKSFDPRTPLGKLMARAYQDGARARGKR